MREREREKEIPRLPLFLYTHVYTHLGHCRLIHVIFMWTNTIPPRRPIAYVCVMSLNFIGPNDCHTECHQLTVLQTTLEQLQELKI